jgi:hypothetical protein
MSDRKCSATNIFLSFDMLIARIFLVSDSIISIHNHITSEPTLSQVSSFICKNELLDLGRTVRQSFCKFVFLYPISN